MMLNCVFCGKEIDGHSEGNIHTCMRRMARNKIIRIAFRILKILGMCKRK